MTALIEAPLRKRFAHVRVENDAVAALEAERRWGALQGFDHCAYVTWSTGVGVGLCVDGRVLRGKNGNAGHAGHIFVVDDDSDALCGCGNVGDVEGLVAGNAIARRFGCRAEGAVPGGARGEPEALHTTDALCRVMGRIALQPGGHARPGSRPSAWAGACSWHNRDPARAPALPFLSGSKSMVHSVAVRSSCSVAAAGNAVAGWRCILRRVSLPWGCPLAVLLRCW